MYKYILDFLNYKFIHFGSKMPQNDELVQKFLITDDCGETCAFELMFLQNMLSTYNSWGATWRSTKCWQDTLIGSLRVVNDLYQTELRSSPVPSTDNKTKEVC